LDLTIFALRYSAFSKVHKQDMRNRAAMAGIKI
jgi:hypothetical protein